MSALSFENVDVDYGDRHAVHDFDETVRSGEWLGLIGPNGAGKSSLLRAVAGLVEHRGRIVIDGVSGSVVADTRDAAIRARFARAPTGRFRTQRGEIEIAYRAGSGAALDAVATGGCVFVDGVVRSGCGEVQQAVVGPIHGGGGRLELRARDGDIRMFAERAPAFARSSHRTAAVTAAPVSIPVSIRAQ